MPLVGSRKLSVLFLLIAGGLVAAGGLFNFLVDPLDEHAHEIVPPRAHNSRVEMARFIQAWPKEPTALVIGSSRSQGVPLDVARELTGSTARRVAVAGMKPEEYLMFTRYAVEEASVPVTDVIAAFDVESFLFTADPSEGLKTAALEKFWPDWYGAPTLADRYGKWQRHFSLSQLAISLNGLRAIAEGEQGDLVPFSLREAGTPVPAGVNTDAVVAHWLADKGGVSDFSRVDLRRLKEFVKFIQYLDSRGISLNVYLTPLQPVYRAEAAKHGLDNAVQLVTVAALDALPGQETAFRDFTDVSSFGGDPHEFSDGSHHTTVNGGRILRELFEGRTQ